MRKLDDYSDEEIKNLTEKIKKINKGIKKKKKKRVVEKTEPESDSDSENKEENEKGEHCEKLEAFLNDDEAAKIARCFNLKEYNFDNLPLDVSVLVVGKRRYGKTIWSRDFLSKRWPYFPDGGFCFTKTKFNYFWHQHFPDTRIYNGMDWDAVFEILEIQKMKWEAVMNGDYCSIPYIIIQLDDIISSRKDMRYNDLLLELIFAGRHYKITIIINVQDIKGVPPDVRQNMDLIVITYQTQERQIETLLKEYGDFFPNKKVFRELIKQNTQDHQVLIVDQTEAKYNVEDVFFKHKANQKPPPFKIGDLDFWKIANCNWEEQLNKYNNIPDRTLDDWKKIAGKRWKEERKKAILQQTDSLDDRLESNQLIFAPPSIQLQKILKLYQKIGDSHVVRAYKNLNNLQNYAKYIPGTSDC